MCNYKNIINKSSVCTLKDNQMNTVHLNYGLTGLNWKARLGMHWKLKKIGDDPISISPNSP